MEKCVLMQIALDFAPMGQIDNYSALDGLALNWQKKYLNHYWPSSKTPYGVTMPLWIKTLKPKRLGI